jgi:ketosteroid isomerase-like protein
VSEVSQHDDVAVVRAFTDAMRAGDIDTCLTMIAPDLVFSEAESLPFGGDYHGEDGFLQLLREVGRHLKVELGTPEITGGKGLVAVRVDGTMTARATGRSMQMDVVDLYRLSAGKVTRVDVFYKEPTAVADLCREHEGATP